MGARGRQSSAARQTVVVEGGFGRRPEPPKGLTEDQARIWRETVASEKSDFFKTAASRSLLEEYCRHKATAAMLSRLVDEFDLSLLSDDEQLKRYDLLLKARDRETKAIASTLTKLRLTNQSRYTPQAAATAAKRSGGDKKPWEHVS